MNKISHLCKFVVTLPIFQSTVNKTSHLCKFVVTLFRFKPHFKILIEIRPCRVFLFALLLDYTEQLKQHFECYQSFITKTAAPLYTATID